MCRGAGLLWVERAGEMKGQSVPGSEISGWCVMARACSLACRDRGICC